MILRDILTIFNFRTFRDGIEDIDSIRVYFGEYYPKRYFDIGLDSWSDEQEEIMDTIFKPEFLIREIEYIDCENGFLRVYLADEEEED